MTSQQSMPVTIPATQAHRQFGDLIRRVFSGTEHFVVEKDGLPVVAIISMQEYRELMDEREKRRDRVRHFQKMARSVGEAFEEQGLTEGTLDAQVEAVREELYQERHGKQAE